MKRGGRETEAQNFPQKVLGTRRVPSERASSVCPRRNREGKRRLGSKSVLTDGVPEDAALRKLDEVVQGDRGEGGVGKYAERDPHHHGKDVFVIGVDKEIVEEHVK